MSSEKVKSMQKAAAKLMDGAKDLREAWALMKDSELTAAKEIADVVLDLERSAMLLQKQIALHNIADAII